MPHEVFISRAEEDAAPANEISGLLEAAGIRCWIAHRDVPPGQEYPAAITRAIRSSRLVLLILSPAANQSRHVLNEIALAVNSGIPIQPVRVAEIAPSDALSYYIAALQWLDAFPPPVSAHLGALREAIRTSTSAAPEPQEEQAAAPPVQPAPRAIPPPPVDEPARDVERLVGGYLAEHGLPGGIRRHLLIFSTTSQKTWLTFTEAGLFCTLDNRGKAGVISIQWFEPASTLDEVPVSAEDRAGRPGRLHIGRHRGWLFSRALFGRADKLVEIIRNEIAGLLPRSGTVEAPRE